MVWFGHLFWSSWWASSKLLTNFFVRFQDTNTNDCSSTRSRHGALTSFSLSSLTNTVMACRKLDQDDRHVTGWGSSRWTWGAPLPPNPSTAATNASNQMSASYGNNILCLPQVSLGLLVKWMPQFKKVFLPSKYVKYDIVLPFLKNNFVNFGTQY